MRRPDIIVLHGVPFAVAVPCSRDACSKCMFGTPGKHECKASDLMDMNVVPVCDTGGIGYDCYYRKPTASELADEELQRLADKESESTSEEDW